MKEFELYDWLSKKWDTSRENAIQILRTKEATDFLVVWSFFEKHCFEGFISENKIKEFSLKNDFLFEKSNFFCEFFTCFYERYQDRSKKSNLLHRRNCEKFEGILRENVEGLTQADKLFFILFVVYRYRNNLFHGNKAVLAWKKYSDQINKCIKVMIEINDLKSDIDS